jgi:basic amino acid/polyamine antiporter, APA family
MARSMAIKLERGFGLLHATALNVSNMVGVGPFITIPLLLTTAGGPQAVLGWFTGAILVLADGQIWSELGAALPGSGGSYHFLREAYGPAKWGRLMAFLFIWQFLLSGPLEIASGMIGFSEYAGYLAPMTPFQHKLLAAGVGLLATLVLSQKITTLGRITVTLWAGTLLTMAAILLVGAPHLSVGSVLHPLRDLSFGKGFLLGLGGATLLTTYNYLGYYDVCYIGDEVRDPGRVIPRSILYSIVFCVLTYVSIHVVVLAVVPWQEAQHSHALVSDFMQRLQGHWAAVAITVMVLWTAFGSVFALLLGYSRVPYAAARDGYFFRSFARVHATREYPHVSLYVVGATAMLAAFFTLDQVVSALITTRILVQFIGQILAVPLLRKRMAASERPYKMPLYPLPLLVSGLGWTYVFVTAGATYVAIGIATLAAGGVAFLVWSRARKAWPF